MENKGKFDFSTTDIIAFAVIIIAGLFMISIGENIGYVMLLLPVSNIIGRFFRKQEQEEQEERD